ncbi:hypothetical protein FHS43_003900 [Streptosporangium becharense]|uniref:Uncharacterized protein n=1 Tax=Streptosporangium becharense TaxID=1816182 RepID=A0A7W9II59_9ACTN|nr:hypothetical protein [Streptosporangium becharense]MBB2912617.1 hypothetical protein [Streptosporangium becharense]MBB5820553.1 hypothetical protein [Streptosporangium becharense]
MITASVAIGVFGAGAGLGTVIATRATPLEEQTMRLAAGTYLLDDQAGAWASQGPGGDQPLPLSGSDAGSTVTDGAKEPRVCLSATVDGRAVGAVAEGCTGLPVLASAGAALAPLRPGNPKSTPDAPPPRKSAEPRPSSSAKPPAKTSAPRDNGRPQGSAQPAPDPGRQGPAQPPPPVNNPQPAPPPAPTPTKKISGNITESENDNGSVIERPVEKKVDVVSPPTSGPGTGRTRAPGDTGPGRPRQTGDTGPGGPRPTDGGSRGTPQPPVTVQPPQPGGGTPRASQPGNPPRPPQPAGTPRATGGMRPSQPPVTARPPQPGDDASRPTRPVGTLRPAVPRSGAGPIVPSAGTGPADGPATTVTVKPTAPRRTAAPTPSPRPGDTRPTGPDSGPQPVPPAENGPSQPGGPDGAQSPDGTVLRPATPQTSDGAQNAADVLPVFKDPELMRRAYEALGLDKDMRYTDENGVWDLNIAPPGTPPCRDYTAEELRALDASQDGRGQSQDRAIPRDSCLWPAFIRWLYAEPAPGEVSNWTKFTGLPYRNLELVLMDPAQSPPAQRTPGDGAPGDGAPVRPGQNQPESQWGHEPARPGPGDDPARPDQGQPDPARTDSGGSAPDRTAPVQPGPGQVEPDPDPQTGP